MLRKVKLLNVCFITVVRFYMMFLIFIAQLCNE